VRPLVVHRLAWSRPKASRGPGELGGAWQATVAMGYFVALVNSNFSFFSIRINSNLNLVQT
jgi:hypothetical protein